MWRLLLLLLLVADAQCLQVALQLLLCILPTLLVHPLPVHLPLLLVAAADMTVDAAGAVTAAAAKCNGCPCCCFCWSLMPSACRLRCCRHEC